MCQVSGITKVNDSNREMAWEFMKLLGKEMSKGNSDGLGYAAFDKSGKIFGERWFLNKTAFTDLGDDAGKTSKIYNSFGEKVSRDEAQAIILHTRMATCDKSLKNTHPFVDNIDDPKSAIIHNGIISNHMSLMKKFSTCDSEVIVHLYEEYKAATNFDDISKVMKKLQGWYTVLGLSTDENGQMIMDIFTDSNRLHSIFVHELGTEVYCTYSQNITKVAGMLGMSCGTHLQVDPNNAYRVDVLTGVVTKQLEVKSKYVYNDETVPDSLDAWLKEHISSRK